MVAALGVLASAGTSSSLGSAALDRSDGLLLVGIGLLLVTALVLAGAAALLNSARGIVGAVAYVGLVGSLIAFIPLGDRYFTLGIWVVTASCLVLTWLLLGRIPLRSPTFAGAGLEFAAGTRAGHHPHQAAATAAIAVLLLAAGILRPRLRRGPSMRGFARWPWGRLTRPRPAPSRRRRWWPMRPSGGGWRSQARREPPREARPPQLTIRTGYLGGRFDHIGRIAGSLFGWDKQYTRTGRPYQLPDLSIDEVRKVNTGFGTKQGSENCRKVSVGAVWRLLDREAHLPELFKRGDIGELEQYLGRQFVAYDDFDEIVRIMQEAKDGAIGIIAVNKPAPIDVKRDLEQLKTRPRAPLSRRDAPHLGHVFNAVNDGDTIQFLDFQGGKARHARRWRQWGIIVIRGIDQDGKFIFHDFRK